MPDLHRGPDGAVRPVLTGREAAVARMARRNHSARWAHVYLLYAVGVLLWESVGLTPAGSWWGYELFNIFAPWFFLTSTLLLLVFLPFAGRVAGLWLIIPVVLFGWEHGGLFLPRQMTISGVPLRVMTANLLISNGDTSAVVATVAEQQPDVLMVQELGHAMAGQLTEVLGGRYPYRILEPSDSPSGMGILSRYPVSVAASPDVLPENCSCQRVILDLLGRAVTIVHVHPPQPTIRYASWGPIPLPANFDVGDTQRTLRAAIGELGAPGRFPNPALVVGDFNVSDRQPFYRELRRRFGDAYRQAGWGFGFTFPNAPFDPHFFGVHTVSLPLVPLARIDYVLSSDAWVTVAAHTGNMPGSDHRFVVAELILQ